MSKALVPRILFSLTTHDEKVGREWPISVSNVLLNCSARISKTWRILPNKHPGLEVEAVL